MPHPTPAVTSALPTGTSRPVRTCVGCRGRGLKVDLVRLVSRDGVLVLDRAQTEPGRGAYLHPTASCVHQAVRRSALGRALRAPVKGNTLPELMASVLPEAVR